MATFERSERQLEQAIRRAKSTYHTPTDRAMARHIYREWSKRAGGRLANLRPILVNRQVGSTFGKSRLVPTVLSSRCGYEDDVFAVRPTYVTLPPRYQGPFNAPIREPWPAPAAWPVQRALAYEFELHPVVRRALDATDQYFSEVNPTDATLRELFIAGDAWFNLDHEGISAPTRLKRIELPSRSVIGWFKAALGKEIEFL